MHSAIHGATFITLSCCTDIWHRCVCSTDL